MRLLHYTSLVLSLVILSSGQSTFPPIFPIEGALVEAGDLGKIQGALSYTSPTGSNTFVWFAGIPYAEPSSYTGTKRFQPSTLKTGPLNGTDVFYAVNPFVMCPQRDIFYKTDYDKSDLGSVMKAYKESKKRENREKFDINPQVIGTEECLVINVNTPKLPQAGDPLLPVIFFIHGGSFDSIWGGIFGGHRFLNRDVVFVSINMRLGLFGSLNLGVDEAPGNALMYDVYVALEWVQKYIHFFGGDKAQVTVSGHSAGAVMATHLMTSPLLRGKNYFQKIIGLSGSSVSSWATCTDPLTQHLRASELAGCDVTVSNKSEIAECMAGKTIFELMEALNNWEDEDKIRGRFGMDAKVPSLQDPATLSPDFPIFMDQTPLEVFLENRQINVPVMLGGTRHDGTFMMEATYDDFLRPNGWLEDIPKLRNELFSILLEGVGMEDITGGEMIHAMAHTYMGADAMNSDNFTDMIPGMIDMHTVLAFKAGAYNLIEMHSKVNPASYYFSFDYFGFWTVDGGDVIPGGVGHIDSVFYLFQAFPLIVWPFDLLVSQRFVNYWVNFATFGNPNGEPGSDILFPPFNIDTHTYLSINLSDRIGYNCRDSWINNSLEIKDHQRPGWPVWPLPSTPDPSQESTTSLPSDPTTPTSLSPLPSESSETTDPTTPTSLPPLPSETTDTTDPITSTEGNNSGHFLQPLYLTTYLIAILICFRKIIK